MYYVMYGWNFGRFFTKHVIPFEQFSWKFSLFGLGIFRNRIIHKADLT